MDPVRLKVLQAEVKAQLDRIARTYLELEDRAGQIQPESTPMVESTAYQLHNLYSAISD